VRRPSFGKSWRLSRFCIDRAERFPGCCRIALVAQTTTSLWRDCIGGRSGVVELSAPWFQPKLHKNGKMLSWPNGSTLHLFTAEEPRSLRGPNNDFGAVEEMAAQPYAQEAWDQLQMTMRSGEHPQTIIATTPKKMEPLVSLVQDPNSAVTIGSTTENKGNVARSWLKSHVEPLIGTRFGTEEIEGKIVFEEPGALFKLDWFDRDKWCPDSRRESRWKRIGIGVDPAETSGSQADEWGIVAAALREDGLVEILEDASMNALPEVAASAAVALYWKYGANFMVADVGRSGKLVHSVVKLIDPRVHVLDKGGNKGKRAWAENVSVLYSQHGSSTGRPRAPRRPDGPVDRRRQPLAVVTRPDGRARLRRHRVGAQRRPARQQGLNSERVAPRRNAWI
jgi:phage terminase large subunit-like protein